MISVVNRKAFCIGEYIGRPSPLGNPFHMNGEEDRDRVCDSYEKWLGMRIDEDNRPVMDELRRLMAIHREKGELVLVCWCAPRRCHGEAIRDAILKMEEMDNG